MIGSKKLLKRELLITDSSQADIVFTLWGDRAKMSVSWTGSAHHDEPAPIILIKNAKIGNYCGRSISLQSNSLLYINPQIPEAFDLHRWRLSKVETSYMK